MSKKTELTKLQRDWYAKLKKAGFKDIEILLDNGQFCDLLIQSCGINPKRHPIIYEETYNYYRYARQFLNEHPFRTRKDYLVWTQYSEGIPYRKIAKNLSLSLRKVFEIINAYRNGPFKEWLQTLTENDTE
jgi:hypothetical protein